MGCAASTVVPVQRPTLCKSASNSSVVVVHHKTVQQLGSTTPRWATVRDLLHNSPVTHRRQISSGQIDGTNTIRHMARQVSRLPGATDDDPVTKNPWAAYDYVESGYLIINSDKKILYSNMAANYMFEYSGMGNDKLTSNNIRIIIIDDIFERFPITRTDNNHELNNTIEIQSLTKNCRTIYLKITYSKITINPDDAFYGYLISLTNITQKRLLQDELLAKNQQIAKFMRASFHPIILEKIRNGETDIVTEHNAVVVAFCDMKGSTELSRKMRPIEIAKMKCVLYKQFDKLVNELEIIKIETAGDCYEVACGLFDEKNPADKVIRFMKDAMSYALHELKIEMRSGVHIGEVASSVAGDILPHLCLSGETVNKASRLESNGVPGKVHVSAEILQLLDQQMYNVEERGSIDLKGFGQTLTFFVDPIS